MCLFITLEPIRVERPPRRQIQNDVDDAYAHVDDVRRRLQVISAEPVGASCVAATAASSARAGASSLTCGIRR